VLHLESFIEDLEQAWSAFSAKLGRDVQFRERVLQRAREDPPLSVHESAAGTSSAAMSVTSLSLRGHLAGATHFGPLPFATRWETEPPRDDDGEDKGPGGKQ
jgi:hypothetical protein